MFRVERDVVHAHLVIFQDDKRPIELRCVNRFDGCSDDEVRSAPSVFFSCILSLALPDSFGSACDCGRYYDEFSAGLNSV